MAWLLAIGAAVAGVATLASGPGWPAVLLLVVGLGLAVTCEIARRSRPVAYEVDADLVVVCRRGRPDRRFTGPVRDVRRGKLGLRVWGSGGLYGYLGRFRADGGRLRAFVTDRHRVVLLAAGETRLALSPNDPDMFVESIDLRRPPV